MKINKIFHTLYFMVMFLPLFIIPIFAININQKEVEPLSIEVHEKETINFNQLIQNGNFVNGTNNWTGVGADIYINNNKFIMKIPTNTRGQIRQDNVTTYANHKYLIKSKFTSDQPITWSFELSRGWASGSLSVNANEITTYEQIITPIQSNDNYLWFMGYNQATNTQVYINFDYIEMFDLTKMYGEGNEPTITEFNNTFSNAYYDYTLNELITIDLGMVTYDNTDIGSQFLYSIYKPVNDYFNFKQYFGMNAIYDWFQLNFFNGTAPLSFFIFFNLMIYWLIISMLWLLFDVLIYVPLMIHRWLDKASIS